MYLTLTIDLNLRPLDCHLNSLRNCVCIKLWPTRDSVAKSAKFIISVVHTILVVVKLSAIKLLQKIYTRNCKTLEKINVCIVNHGKNVFFKVCHTAQDSVLTM